jgi:hypothetical protein
LCGSALPIEEVLFGVVPIGFPLSGSHHQVWDEAGKSAKQVDANTRTRLLAKAEPFREFDPSKLGSREHVKLSDLRGKVVLVDFWFPG